jgi:hypothetical protein
VALSENIAWVGEHKNRKEETQKAQINLLFSLCILCPFCAFCVPKSSLNAIAPSRPAL